MKPYSVKDMIAAYKAAEDADERRCLRQRIAVNVGSRAALREIFGLDSEPLSDFYGECDSMTPSTDDTIKSFLQRYGSLAATAPVETVVPETDYMSMLEGQSVENEDYDVPGDATSSAIDAFLSSNPAPQPRRRPADIRTQDDPAVPLASDGRTVSASVNLRQQNRAASAQEKLNVGQSDAADEEYSAVSDVAPISSGRAELSEGLARIMIKNRNYQKALEIITELNLKNPEKSIYFADQIRFLRKLMVNAGALPPKK